MSKQNSQTTKQMFQTDIEIWHKYHDTRDICFKGYSDQNDIPVNKIITYLQTKSKHILNILDLGCGRNLIKTFFESNMNFNIKGYDHVSFNNSFEVDICQLPDNDYTIDICIFSQSLIGTNYEYYIDEAYRVLRYNGELIISDSIERYDTIKSYLINMLEMYIINDDVNETNDDDDDETKLWFVIHAIKQ